METNTNHTVTTKQITAREIVESFNFDYDILADNLDSARSYFDKLNETTLNPDVKFQLDFFTKKYDETDSMNWKSIIVVDCITTVARMQEEEIQILRKGVKTQLETLLTTLN